MAVVTIAHWYIVSPYTHWSVELCCFVLFLVSSFRPRAVRLLSFVFCRLSFVDGSRRRVFFFNILAHSYCTVILYVSLCLCWGLRVLWQVLGGVSEEQAAEAAHQKSENAEDDVEEKEAVEDGDGETDGGGDEDGVEAMEEDDEPQVTFRL